MANFSFDIVSTYDIGEVNNAVDQAQREIANRYDLKGTSASIEWKDANKGSLKLIGDSEFHLDAMLDSIRKKLASRGQSQKILDPQEYVKSGMTVTQVIDLISGLDQDKAKVITKLLQSDAPKVKAQIQGEAVRVISAKKDELQAVMTLLNASDFDFPISFTNYR